MSLVNQTLTNPTPSVPSNQPERSQDKGEKDEVQITGCCWGRKRSRLWLSGILLWEEKAKQLTFLMLKPIVLQIIVNTTFKFLWVIVGNQDGNKGIQGVKSFLEKKKDKDTVFVKWQISVYLNTLRIRSLILFCSPLLHILWGWLPLLYMATNILKKERMLEARGGGGGRGTGNATYLRVYTHNRIRV